MLQLDRRDFIAALGGSAAVGRMSHEARADALENALLVQTRSPAAHMWRTFANPDALL